MSSLAGILSINRRVTIVDIARLADVSTATVDRVLNGRQGVKETTVKRVMKAAAELGYVDESDERIRDVRPLA
jgi:LacI family transcriptional regulator